MMTTYLQHLTASILVAFLCVPALAFSHGVGASWEQRVGSYTVDIGYTPEVIEAGVQVRFDYLLRHASSSDEVSYTDVWVQIKDTEKTLFAGGIAAARIGSTGLAYVFPTDGQYEMYVRFHDGPLALAETTFTFAVYEEVSSGTPSGGLPTLFIVLVGGLLVAVGGLVFWRRSI